MVESARRRNEREDFYADARTARICLNIITPYLKEGVQISEWNFMPERWKKDEERRDIPEPMTDEEIETVITKMVKPMLDARARIGPGLEDD